MDLKRTIEFETAFNTYSADKIIGEGGSARVFRAADEAGQLFAVKMLSLQRASNAKRKRFKNEIDFSKRAGHPNIVSVIDHGVHTSGKGKSIFYVMPLYKGSLRRLLKEGIRPEKALVYFSKILDGVEAANKMGVVHRDIKPENILYDESNDQLLIADFGIASFQQEELLTAVETKDSERLANFQYAAPEQRTRGLRVDHRADIFALGLILNEMFTGQVISGTEPKTIASVTPEYAYLDDIVSEMIRQEADSRLFSIEKIKQELIVRGNSFIAQQKISLLEGTVIPESEVDDPLVVDPPRLVGANWNGGMLTLTLSSPTNKKWIQTLREPGFSGTTGINYGGFFVGLSTLDFADNIVTTRAPEDLGTIQDIVDLFRDQWLPYANRAYENRITREMKEAEERERMQLQQNLESRKASKRINDSIKI